MKLILKEYLSSLREREELDAILPDLLSQLGLNVYSRPGRGTRQDGVDVGAVGSLDGRAEKVYLFSIKPGNLTRKDWDGESVQSLRPSLNEIVDAYIPNRLPPEHHGKDIVICIAIGGDVLEQVRPQLKGFIDKNETDNISFQEWNGDKLAALIQEGFLKEDLLPKKAQSRFRKSLALLDEPESSFQHFTALVKSLVGTDTLKGKEGLTVIRQISICLWILFAWAREAKNMESAYLSSEIAILYGWDIAKSYLGQDKKITKEIVSAFSSIYAAYQEICNEFLTINIIPYTEKRHAISSAIRPSCSLDVNLKLFDLLGRLGLAGLWINWGEAMCPGDELDEFRRKLSKESASYAEAVKALIFNNPALLVPIKDDQAIDISIAIFFMALDANNHEYLRGLLSTIVDRTRFAYITHGKYPCILNSYQELLSHPEKKDPEYRQKVTAGSILYPTLALWAAILNSPETYKKIADFKEKELAHCNFQFWYPDEETENHLYNNSGSHGAVLSDACVERPPKELIDQVFGECEQSLYFEELSALKFRWWPLIVVACRTYRVPLPVQLLDGVRNHK